jgi:hypothetical protein
MAGLSIPPPTQPLTNENKVTEPWYPIFVEIQTLRSEMDALRRLLRNDGAVDMALTGTATFVGSG